MTDLTALISLTVFDRLLIVITLHALQIVNNNNNNNNNECIYIAQNKQFSDALTRATKQASFQVSGKRRHRQ